MRIPITVQLGGLLLIASLIGLAVISVAVWITVHDFVLDTRASRLALTASLKAAQLASNLDIMQTSASFVTTRVLLQNALQRYNDVRNNTPENWVRANADMQAAVGGEASLGQQLLLQSRMYPRDDTGPAGPYPLMNTTADSLRKGIALPYGYPNGTQVYLGANDTTLGYPPSLYPNLTFTANSPARFGDYELDPGSTLLLGPWDVNTTLSLVSLTMPVTNNTSPDQLLGYVTLLMNARLISQVIASQEGLLKTGKTLLIGPADPSNRFSANLALDAANKPELEVRYVFPLNESYAKRHPDHTQNGTNPSFDASRFPAVYKALDVANAAENSGAQLRATNEAGKKVSVGYAMPSGNMVSWAVLVELSRDEIWQPINTLRKVIVACVFATAGLMAIIAFPLAHFAAQPILLLRAATQKSIEPPSTDGQSDMNSIGYFRDGAADDQAIQAGGATGVESELARKEGFPNPITKWKRKREEDSQTKREERRKRHFRIPGRVKQRRGCIKDELSDLTHTFNEMSDELMMQYSKLDERVRQRTAELELSKRAAEAANESKTLFIANISHELKTPLNGILGMCAVCMQEDDPLRMKRSLGIIYKSGDLLLNLLTDLLTFSKNQVGQHLSLDEKEFRLHDVTSQILAIFENQAKDGQIDLKVQYEGVNHIEPDDPSSDRVSSHGPGQSGRMRDMILWGDIHRILQVVINLVSNSLKFTPPGGSVVLTVRALPELPDLGSRNTSFNSRQSVRWSTHKRDSDLSVPRLGTQRNSDASIPRFSTANAINARDKPHALVQVSERNRSPHSAKYIYFEFEVTDTGPGIPEDIQEKIFEPFVQGDLGLSKKFGGTGLGLSICSQLAGLMKGSIGVRSTPGLGSTFTMKIPLRHVQTRADSSASSAVAAEDGVSRSGSFEQVSRTSSPQRSHGPVEYAPISPGASEPVKPSADVKPHTQQRLVGLSQPYFTTNKPLDSPNSQDEAMKRISATASTSGKIRVLVAEDNKINQEVVLRMLKLEDIYDVVVARDGQEALDVVKESMRAGAQPFNLIFMDVQMPNVDGLTSTRLIREIGYQAPIVALTAFAEESNIKDCMDSGMNYFLSKPIRRPQLKKVLKEYIPPIPEEPEEQVTPTEERGATHNTTIVMVHGRSSQDSKRFETTTESADATFDATGNAFHAAPVSHVAKDDERAASPRTIT
ncbi:Putative signal transduction response regulator, receiver domain, histidine kinase/HSP90-like ATPase [Septoria linicola]|uniref:histidine kinase n=1 Tax=Septoria linicola TaxID=215465 RepID=A0A9Q9ALD4_9PEZI|nr:putative signal transduction response regulator, receiver domain, histidine kinase/HSP90-like ATPase [Septoria linicola]USW49103.1 Putative signal transduction response regulator, receiver domain, histidine kinase/HSP90-like ATPase [Septoria linicola]